MSLVLNYNRVLIGASGYDPSSGLIIFGIPKAAPAFKVGKTDTVLEASDYQEAKNINTVGNDIYPNTAFRETKLTVVNGPTVTWVAPPPSVCALKTDQLAVVAASTKAVRSVTFTDGKRRIAVDKKGPDGIFSVPWKTAKLKKGVHTLHAKVRDAAGRTATAPLPIRICK